MLKASRAQSPVLSPMAAPRENVPMYSFVASVDGRSNRPPEVAPCHRTDWHFVHMKPDALRATGAPAAQARDLQPLRLMRSARQARLRHKHYVRDLQPQVNAAQHAAQDAARLLESRTTGREARRAAGRTERRAARAPSVVRRAVSLAFSSTADMVHHRGPAHHGDRAMTWSLDEPK